MPEAGEGGSPTVRLPHSPRRTFRLIQVLRAVAALMVVGHHATMLLEQRTQRVVTWYNGAAGVDLFFVVSGLVMMLSTARLRRTAGAAWTFAKRRVERVVPLYWLATTAKVVGTLLVPELALHGLGTTWHVVASYLFLPSLGPGQTFEPVMVVGWTLNLEMLFYALIAASLLLGVAEFVVVVPVLGMLVLLRVLHAVPGWEAISAWTDPTLPEFVWGMLLGWAVLRGRTLPRGVAWLAMVLGLCGLCVTPSMLQSEWRGVAWGLPAMAMVAGALALEARWGERVPRWLLLVGDASYSIYLVHAFVLPVLSAGWLGRELMQPGRRVQVGMVGVVLSAVAGVVCYRLIELPMLEWFRLRRGRPAVA